MDRLSGEEAVNKMFSLERVEDYLKNYRSGFGSGKLPMDHQMIEQLADTMRENERLRHDIDDICLHFPKVKEWLNLPVIIGDKAPENIQDGSKNIAIGAGEMVISNKESEHG